MQYFDEFNKRIFQKSSRNAIFFRRSKTIKYWSVVVTYFIYLERKAKNNLTKVTYSHSTLSNVCKLHHLEADNYFRPNKRNADLLVAILVSAISIQFENSISNLDTCHPHFSRAVGARGPGDMCPQFGQIKLLFLNQGRWQIMPTTLLCAPRIFRPSHGPV